MLFTCTTVTGTIRDCLVGFDDI